MRIAALRGLRKSCKASRPKWIHRNFAEAAGLPTAAATGGVLLIRQCRSPVPWPLINQSRPFLHAVRNRQRRGIETTERLDDMSCDQIVYCLLSRCVAAEFLFPKERMKAPILFGDIE